MIKKDDLTIQNDDLIKESYVPSETEMKRVVMYYFLLWILFALSNNHLSKYEYYHLKQAIGWWIVFFLVFITSMFVMWIPVIRLFRVFSMILLLIILGFFIYQVVQRKYTVTISDKEKVPLAIFAGIWNWLLELFDKKFEIK